MWMEPTFHEHFCEIITVNIPRYTNKEYICAQT